MISPDPDWIFTFSSTTSTSRPLNFIEGLSMSASYLSRVQLECTRSCARTSQTARTLVLNRCFSLRYHIMTPRHITSLYRRPFTRSFSVSSSRPISLPSLRKHALIDIHPEVASSLAARKPVVALETALVTNGIAPPTNLEIGLKLEEIVRRQGAVPATIGIVDGRVKIGLERKELERLADVGEGKKRKVKVSCTYT